MPPELYNVCSEERARKKQPITDPKQVGEGYAEKFNTIRLNDYSAWENLGREKGYIKYLLEKLGYVIKTPQE